MIFLFVFSFVLNIAFTHCSVLFCFYIYLFIYFSSIYSFIYVWCEILHETGGSVLTLNFASHVWNGNENFKWMNVSTINRAKQKRKRRCRKWWIGLEKLKRNAQLFQMVKYVDDVVIQNDKEIINAQNGSFCSNSLDQSMFRNCVLILRSVGLWLWLRAGWMIYSFFIFYIFWKRWFHCDSNRL